MTAEVENIAYCESDVFTKQHEKDESTMDRILQFDKAHIQDHLSVIVTDWLLNGLNLESLTRCHAVFSTDSECKKDIIERRLSNDLRDSLHKLYGYNVVTIEIILHQSISTEQVVENESKEFHRTADRVSSCLSDIESIIIDTRAGLKKLLDVMDEESDIAGREEQQDRAYSTISVADEREEAVLPSKGDECPTKSSVLQLIREYVLKRIGWQAETWFEGLELTFFSDQKIILCTNTDFKQHIIMCRLGDYIKDAINESYGYDVDLEIILRQDGT